MAILRFQKLLNNHQVAQLFFPFQTGNNHDSYLEEDFLLLDENSAALNFLKEFFAQKDFVNSRFPSLLIKGPQASGKTHLLNIFARKFHAEFLTKEKLSEVNPAGFFAANHFYIFENIEQIENDELLFHLINSAFEAKAFLILTSVPQVNFQLKDLMSRLRNIFAVEIKNPSDETIKQLLVNGFARRQIALSNQVINFISDNIAKNYAAIFLLIKKVELHCQESGKNLTVKEIAEIMKL